MRTIKRVRAVYFSPTGTTRKVVATVAKHIARALNATRGEYNFTLPETRTAPLTFADDELVVFGTPVYAGRVPNVLLPYLATIAGNGALAVPVTVFGNRNYDDALVELRDILARGGLNPVAAAAFVGEHSFSRVLAKDRPDTRDLDTAAAFALAVAATCNTLPAEPPLVEVPGTPYPYRRYYTPRDRHGNPIDIRKVKPLTNDRCNDCGLCAKVCPMGSINPDNVKEITGICIKCGACIKKCPRDAKYYDDAGYLYHQHELEETYPGRAAVGLFYSGTYDL